MNENNTTSLHEKLARLKEIKLRTGTKKEKLHQTDARAYKHLLHEYIVEMLLSSETGEELDITEIENGLLLEIPHDEFGAIGVKITLALQSLDYDVNAMQEQYQEKIRKAEKRELDKKNKRVA